MVAEDDKSVEGFHTLVVIWMRIVIGSTGSFRKDARTVYFIFVTSYRANPLRGCPGFAIHHV